MFSLQFSEEVRRKGIFIVIPLLSVSIFAMFGKKSFKLLANLSYESGNRCRTLENRFEFVVWMLR